MQHGLRLLRILSASAMAALLAVLPLPAHAETSPGTASWTIRKDHWDQADEDGFGRFVTAIGESTCADPGACFESAANPWRHTDPPNFSVDGDCADFIYQLRAYYAWKNGLPFSFAIYMMPLGGQNAWLEDRRFTRHGNMVIGRLQLQWQTSTDPVQLFKSIRHTVSTAMFRTDSAYDHGFNASDFYSPRIDRTGIRPGTVVYDINGHVYYVYKITPDGKIHLLDSNPDRRVTRTVFGRHVPHNAPFLGAGFMNFRPIRLVDYAAGPGGALVGGRFELARNNQIADYSGEQFFGTEENPSRDWTKARYIVGGAEMKYFDFVAARMAPPQAQAAATD
ncbi:MAG TPA: hypothetical protein PL096_06775 [Micropepsaceae bacterium]|nr:hypothetical protein [Micropepsaceae bacterium]